MKKIKKMACIGFLTLFSAPLWAQDVTLRVWDTFADQTKGMQDFIDAFEKENPNIKIQRDVQSVDEMRPVIQTALNAGTGPDILYYDTGPAFAGALAKAGLLRPLDDMYESGVLDAVYPWTRERTRFDGTSYGIGNEVEFLGIYYNKDMFTELGLEVPTSYEELLQISAKIKDAGKIPFSFGDADGWPAFHIFSMYANNIIPKDQLELKLFEGASWDDPATAASIKPFFVEMNEAGFLPPSVNAVNYDDATNLFNVGLAAMMPTGTWLIQNISANASFEAGWFFMPKPGGGDPLPPAGLGSGYFLSAGTEHPEEAKKFLAFLFDPANAKYWVEGMSVIPPFKVDTADMDINPLTKFAMEALATVPMGYNIDVLTPDAFNTVMLDGFQAVLGGDRTPEEQAAALQAAVK